MRLQTFVFCNKIRFLHFQRQSFDHISQHICVQKYVLLSNLGDNKPKTFNRIKPLYVT